MKLTKPVMASTARASQLNPVLGRMQFGAIVAGVRHLGKSHVRPTLREVTVSARTRGVALAIAGIIAPIWFITLVIIQGILQPDYSHITMPVSALAAWPAGWMQCLNFYGVAALMAIFVVGVHRTVQPMRYGLLGIVLLLASCLGLVIAGLFPWIMVNGVPTETKPHVVGAILSFSGASTGFIALSRRMRADARWRSVAPYVLTTGLVMLILFIVLGAFAIEDGTPLHPWAGLLQRVVVLLWFACTTTIAFRALRVGSNAISAGAA